MEQKNQHHNSGFGNGFVLGLLVGVVATLLITTKRGRELFREFTERGFDKISDLEEKVKETASNVSTAKDEYDEIEEEGDDYIPEEPQPVRLSERTEEKREYREPRREEQHNGHAHKSPVRRFFRGGKKS